MEFRTEVKIKKAVNDISYHNSVMMIGSCFVENIGRKMLESRFKIDVNPFGISYNPLSIEKSLRILLNKQEFTEDDLFLHNGVWNSFMHHGSFSDISKEYALKNINNRIQQSAEILTKADYVIITFGTAWIYELKTNHEVVNNCHKMADKTFERRCLHVDEIIEAYSQLINIIHVVNPHVKFIFTVSPIRHWKDGAHENQLSKSTLLLAINELQQHFSQIDYFPAYEIVMDELRDYRFYNEDMIHISDTAIQYIWEKFTATYFTDETRMIQQQIMQLIKAGNHKPFNPESKEHQHFLHTLQERKADFKKRYPFIDI